MKPLMVVSILLLCACHSKEQQKQQVIANLAPPAISASYEAVPSEEETNDDEYSGELIMKSANFRFQVDDVEKSTKNIEKLVLAYKAFVATENLSSDINEKSNGITIRVPSISFEVLLEELSKESLFINYRRITSQNVTEEYHDVNTRLKTKKEVRDRYTDILKTKAKTVEDVLKAEEHIRVLQEEIESKEERIKFLQSRVSMSEINLDIYQKVIYKESPTLVEKSYGTKFIQALADGWLFVTATSLYLIGCWPLLIAGVLLFWWWRIWWKKWNNRMTQEI